MIKKNKDIDWYGGSENPIKGMVKKRAWHCPTFEDAIAIVRNLEQYDEMYMGEPIHSIEVISCAWDTKSDQSCVFLDNEDLSIQWSDVNSLAKFDYAIYDTSEWIDTFNNVRTNLKAKQEQIKNIPNGDIYIIGIKNRIRDIIDTLSGLGGLTIEDLYIRMCHIERSGDYSKWAFYINPLTKNIESCPVHLISTDTKWKEYTLN